MRAELLPWILKLLVEPFAQLTFNGFSTQCHLCNLKTIFCHAAELKADIFCRKWNWNRSELQLLKKYRISVAGTQAQPGFTPSVDVFVKDRIALYSDGDKSLFIKH